MACICSAINGNIILARSAGVLSDVRSLAQTARDDMVFVFYISDRDEHDFESRYKESQFRLSDH